MVRQLQMPVDRSRSNCVDADPSADLEQKAWAEDELVGSSAGTRSQHLRTDCSDPLEVPPRGRHQGYVLVVEEQVVARLVEQVAACAMVEFEERLEPQVVVESNARFDAPGGPLGMDGG